MRVLGVLLAVLPAASLLWPAPAVAEAPRRAASAAAKPSRAVKPARAAKPAKAAKPSKPAKSSRTAKSAKSARAAKPSKSSNPSRSSKASAARAAARDPLGSCTAALTARKVAWKPAARPGIVHGVEITGPLGGVALSSPSGPLVLDCSLAVSLDEAGRYLRELGLDAATFSSAYARRNVRGTNRPSKHGVGLAIDVAAFAGPALGALRVDRDYEQGLGDAVDCLGRPLTQGGAVLRLLQCQLVRSGLFHLVLSPDYDDAHHDHFHLQARPWSERAAVRAEAPAIH